MGLQPSKEELVYQQVSYRNIEGIKILHRGGAGLEWTDREGKTPLIVACMKPEHFDVATSLIELGANLNAYCPGRRAGTPLHHAAKGGLKQTVELLLSHGANALVLNDDCQTPLDVARTRGHSNVVHAIESHICVFSGWLRELYMPGFLEAFVPQWASRKIWAVVIPRGSRNPTKPQKFELAIYPGLQARTEEPRRLRGRCESRRRRRRRQERQVAEPYMLIQLWKANIDQPNLNESNPSVVIIDRATKTRFKFLSENEGDKLQLERFYNACRATHQLNIPTPAFPTTAPTATLEDVEYSMTPSGSQSVVEGREPSFPTHSGSKLSNTNAFGSYPGNVSQNSCAPTEGPSTTKISSRGWSGEAVNENTYVGLGVPVAGPSQDPVPCYYSQLSTIAIAPSMQNNPPTAPSAPPVPAESPADGPVHYPTIDSSPVDAVEIGLMTSEWKEDGDDASASCIICLDAPKEGAFVPCGHVVGCIPCMNDVKDKGRGCPICRAKIHQVIKLYAV